MNFLWPQKIKTEPGGVARLGRVLHWFFALVAIACAVGGVVGLGIGLTVPEAGYDADAVAIGLGFLVWGGGGFFFFGRAVRYVLSGE